MKEFFNKCINWVKNDAINWVKDNMILSIVIAAVAVIMLVVIIALIVKGAKNVKAKKAAAQQTTAKATPAVSVSAPVAKAPEKSAAEKAADEKAARQAVLDRLAAEEAEAEREEAEKAAAEKAAAEKLAAEQAATEKKAAKAAKPKTVKAAKEPVKEEKSEAAKTKKPVATETDATASAGTKKTTRKPKGAMYEENDEEKAARYNGKWTICRVLTDSNDPEDEMYFFELHASNGEKLLSSEEYTSYNGALRGIETHKTNIEKGNFKITLSKKGDYIFKLLSGKNMLLCLGANYPTKARCESAIESTKRFAKTAVIDENVHDHLIKVPVEDDAELPQLPDGYNGKWVISSNKSADGEEVFYFELFANNGEKLLSSEEYTTYIGAVNGIQTHKTNIEKGNFRISLTKRGDYIYKLLNGNGQLLCLGEHYKTKRRCMSAVESVKRFAKNSPMLTDPEHTTK